MQSGDLSHRISIEASTRVSDGGGSFTTIWVAVPGLTNHPAAKWSMKTAEVYEGGRTVAIADYRIRIRYRRTFKASWRVRDLFTGKYMSIVSSPIDVGNSHQFLEFLAKEVTT